MMFLNWIMLGAAGAAAIPLIIHLLNRSRFRTVQWGAMHLLRDVLVINHRRIQLQRWLLLLVRCAIPALLALCMARPVLTGFQALAGENPSSLVILLDDSYSMSAAVGPKTRFSRALEQAAALLNRQRRGSESAVILMGRTPQAIPARPTLDAAGLARQIALLKEGAGPAEVAASFDQAAALLAQMTQPHRQVVVLSDFQLESWKGIDAEGRRRVRQLLSPASLPSHLALMPVTDAAAENIAVESLESGRTVVGVGQSVNYRATLANHGRKAWDNLRVYFRIDGVERSASQITLAPGETGQLLFTAKYETGGSHLVQVEADAADALKSDNTLIRAEPVIDRIPVLLLSGAPSSEPLRGETDFLEVALQPFAASRNVAMSDLVATTTLDLARFTAKALEGQRAVVLANAARLTAEQQAALVQYVKQGGGLLVFPGDKLDADAHNKLAADFWPAKIESISGKLDDPSAATAIAPQRLDHPALAMFNDRAGGNLTDAAIRRWYRLAPSPGDSVHVMARLDSGDPLLVERVLERGLVIQCAIPADADWSNLPMRPFYPPLMQQLVLHAATRIEPPRNFEAGSVLIAHPPRSALGQTAVLLDPAGIRHELKIELQADQPTVQFPATRRPGIYTLTPLGEKPMHFVATADRRESRIQPMDSGELSKLAEDLGADLVAGAEEFAALDSDRRHGREIWKWALGIVAALLVAELLMENRFMRSPGR